MGYCNERHCLAHLSTLLTLLLLLDLSGQPLLLYLNTHTHTQHTHTHTTQHSMVTYYKPHQVPLLLYLAQHKISSLLSTLTVMPFSLLLFHLYSTSVLSTTWCVYSKTTMMTITLYTVHTHTQHARTHAPTHTHTHTHTHTQHHTHTTSLASTHQHWRHL